MKMIEFLFVLLFLFLINYYLILSVIKGKLKKYNKIFKKKSSDLRMHKHSIYQNAGVIVVGLFLFSSFILWSTYSDNILISENIPRPIIFFISLSVFYFISIYDFVKKIHPFNRLIVQLLVIYFSLTLIAFPIFPINYVPIKVQYIMVIIFWVYIINITNFVDGLDGMLGTALLGLLTTYLIFIYLYDINTINFYIASILSPLIIAFLIFNKPVAKIFLNDSGSIPLGYILGFFLINILKNQNWILFVSIFFYFIIDVTLTLLIKVKNGHHPWARMFDYFFLKPVLFGKKKHTYVLKFIVLYYFFMTIIIFGIKIYNLNELFLLIYSVVFSIIMLMNFKKFKS